MADPDELAHTATADASGERPEAPELGKTLGRYRLERMLGEGGMGVVHAAFDPDLERRVALKVLRKTDAHGEARSRLLREARAMARLTHENVVTVHEVGTSDDRDYVAMELIDGETLAEWLKDKPRDVREIVDAFVAAGRGLAAAHAAGLVHRDFKPHNVLRRRDGKIVVTDFGLARGVENTQAVALDNTLELGDSHPSDLTGITKTGSVLGTPAYMAPEQWLGGVVGAAADQFAFCVALWEALTGSRPFKGETIEELKAEVKRGPAALDASKLPRRLRRTLMRGLEPDPSKRWPNMDVLLGRIRLAEKHIGLAFALVGGALIAALVAIFAMHRGPTCDPPVIDPTQVWQEAYGQTMPPEMSKLFNAQITHWAVARASACTADPLARQVQLHCLDGALVRLDTIRQGMAAEHGINTDDVANEVVDPSICLGPSPPRLGLSNGSDTIEAYKQYATVIAAKEHASSDAANAFAARPKLDACSKSIALIAASNATKEFVKRRSLVNDAVTTSEQCEDDRLHADVLLLAAPLAFESPIIGPKGKEALKRADSAIAHVSEPQLHATLDLLRAEAANDEGNHKEALALADHAEQAYEKNGQIRFAIKAVLVGLQLRFAYGPPEFDTIPSIVERWLPVAERLKEQTLATHLRAWNARTMMANGDIASAHAEFKKLWKQHADASPPHPFEGTVVDRENKPVVGATVASATVLVADSVGVPLAIFIDDQTDEYKLRVTTTDDAGHFKFTDAAETGAVQAQLGDRRSAATRISNGVTLVVEPTRRIAGKIALNGAPSSDCQVLVENPHDRSLPARFVAPVLPDGSFAIDGVTQGAARIGVYYQHPDAAASVAYASIPASAEPITNLTLSVPSSKRKFAVLARSSLAQPLEAAQVLVLAGTIAVKTIAELDGKTGDGMLVQFARHVTGEAIPHDLVANYRSGDLAAVFSDVPDGTLTVCAIGLPADLQDEALSAKIQKHRGELELGCTTVDGQTNSAVVIAPPTKNLD